MATTEESDRNREEAPTSTRERLMEAAMEYLAEKGVLGGLNLREIADRVGVTPANIYHYFGSRRGLLRAALTQATERLLQPLAMVEGLPFEQRRLRMFDEITQRPDLRLGALLALDEDPDYAPLPFLQRTKAAYEAQREAGLLPEHLDVIAAHLLTLAASIGVAIFRDSAARQLGVDRDLLTARTRAVLERWLAAAKPPAQG